MIILRWDSRTFFHQVFFEFVWLPVYEFSYVLNDEASDTDRFHLWFWVEIQFEHAFAWSSFEIVSILLKTRVNTPYLREFFGIPKTYWVSPIKWRTKPRTHIDLLILSNISLNEMTAQVVCILEISCLIFLCHLLNLTSFSTGKNERIAFNVFFFASSNFRYTRKKPKTKKWCADTPLT